MLKLNHVTKTFNPGTVNAKTALDVVFGIESRIDLTVFHRQLRKFLYLRRDRGKISCEIHWQPLLSVSFCKAELRILQIIDMVLGDLPKELKNILS